MPPSFPKLGKQAYTHGRQLYHARGAKRLRGSRFGSQHRGACQRPGWVLGAGGGRPLPHPSPPENFLKTQMLNPAFWWLLAVKFLAFWKLRPRSWGTNTLLVPNLKVGDQSPPFLWLLRLCITHLRHVDTLHCENSLRMLYSGRVYGGLWWAPPVTITQKKKKTELKNMQSQTRNHALHYYWYYTIQFPVISEGCQYR